MAKYRLLVGKHTQKEDTGQRDKDGNPVRVIKSYRAGEVFESHIDLVARFNGPGSTYLKFERVEATAEQRRSSQGPPPNEPDRDEGKQRQQVKGPPATTPTGK